MCIIIHKDHNIPCPDKNILETCFYNNPDGAGLAILRPESKKVEIHKGFMYFKDFYDFASSTASDKDMVTYHFRISTSGGVNPENCHPFPVSSSIKKLKALSLKSRFAFIHNGVIGQGSSDLSDTQLYIKDKLARMDLRTFNYELSDVLSKDTIGSRTLLIDGKTHQIIKTGSWIDDPATGLLFSNHTYMKNKYSYYNDFYDTNDYSSYLWDDLDICPYCNHISDLISEHHNLYECSYCHAVFDMDGQIWIEGKDEATLL